MPEPRVLVLEDEDVLRDVWVEALKESGYTALGVGSGAEALAQVPVLRPDVVLLDVMMPDMDGIQFLARLRTNPDWAHIPVIIVSGIGEGLLQVTDRPLAQVPGLRVAAILQKPVRVDTLIDHVRRVVGPGGAQQKGGKNPHPPSFSASSGH